MATSYTLSRVIASDLPNLAITYDGLLRRTGFPGLLSRVLHLLEEEYHTPVDIEYTVSVPEPDSSRTGSDAHPAAMPAASSLKTRQTGSLARRLTEGRHSFSPRTLLYPRGLPAPYYPCDALSFRSTISSLGMRPPVMRSAGSGSQLNSKLEQKSFICIGPGRWGCHQP